MMLPVSLIAAVGSNGVIGINNTLPWRLPGDLKHFRQTTLGKPVLMGRRTWDSIGRPLPGRFVVVLSTDPSFNPPGVLAARGIEEGLAMASRVGEREGAGEIMVAGGGTLYAETIGRARRLYLTEVDLAPDGDVFFPRHDRDDWVESERRPQAATASDDAHYAFVIYDRR